MWNENSKAGFDSDADGVTETAGKKKECCISASVQNKAQLDTVVNSKIRYIYLEEDVEFERETVVYSISLPCHIFSERIRSKDMKKCIQRSRKNMMVF